MIAAAVTGPTPGIATSLRQDSFSRAIVSTDLSARSIFPLVAPVPVLVLRAIQAPPRQLGRARCEYALQRFIQVASTFAQRRTTLELQAANVG
jgi:hypothetical protein